MWLYLAIFGIEFIWSWVSNQVNLSVVKRKPWKAGTYGVVSASISWAVAIWVLTQDPWAAIPAIIGDTLGDIVSASRKQKRKKKGTSLVNI
jgi:hypothetical protein